MTRKRVQPVLDWLDHQIDHPHHPTPPSPADSWLRLCMMMSRSAWDQSPWATSANLAWNRVPAKYRHHTRPNQVPAGAICFGLFNSRSGHAWVAGRGTMDRRIGFTVDYRRSGRIDRAPLNLPNWTHDTLVWWTGWSPFCLLPLWDDDYNERHFKKPAVYK